MQEHYNYFKNNLLAAFKMTTEEKYIAKWGTPANKLCLHLNLDQNIPGLKNLPLFLHNFFYFTASSFLT